MQGPLKMWLLGILRSIQFHSSHRAGDSSPVALFDTCIEVSVFLQVVGAYYGVASVEELLQKESHRKFFAYADMR